MINQISLLLSEGIGSKLNSSDNEKAVYAYSIEVLISLLLNLIILSITASYLNKKLELLVFIIFFSGLRTYAGGYHAKTHVECICISFFIFLISAMSSSYLKQFGEIILIVGILFSIFMVFWRSPSETKNKPLTKNQRKKHQVISRVTVLILSFVAITLYFFKVETNFIYITAVMSITIESISLLKA